MSRKTTFFLVASILWMSQLVNAQIISKGPYSASACATGTGNTWANPTRASTSDDSYATYTSAATNTSADLTAKNFNFNIPSTAVIYGLKVEIERKSNYNTSGLGVGYINDNAVYLVNGATQTDISSNKAAAANWNTTDEYITYGGAADVWSAGLTAAIINSTTFGIRLRATITSGLTGGFTNKIASVDHIRLTVYYDYDADGDGILNALDIDCDNDGTVDYLEVNSCAGSQSLNWNSYADGTNPTSINVTNDPTTMTVASSFSAGANVGTYQIENYFTGTTEKEININQQPTAFADKSTTTINFSYPIYGTTFKLQDIDYSAGTWIDSVRVTLSYKGVSIILTPAQVTTSIYNFYKGNNIFIGRTANAATNSTDGQLIIACPYMIDKITIDYWNNDVAHGAQRLGIGGLTFCHVSAADNDADGIPNYLDLDSDNDGIPDVIENYGVDTNGDGRIDNFIDVNSNGLADNAANTSATIGLGLQDFDGDGIPNYIDLDSDNDGIPDILEAAGTDADNDGKVDSFSDADGDGFHNPLDGDQNNDGVIDNAYGPLLKSGTDTDNDGKANSWPNKNIDRLGYPNFLDLDSDGDGISDFEESGLRAALGLSFGTNAYRTIATGTLSTSGWSNTVDALTGPLTFINTDGIGNPNYLDIDSDNDGITDNVEAISTTSYIVSSDTDTDGDGLVDSYDSASSSYGGNALTPTDTDSDSTPDYIDTNSDDDIVLDLNEGDRANVGLTQTTINTSGDTDGDGLMDYFDTFNITTATAGTAYKNYSMSNMGPLGNFDGPTPSGSSVQLQKSDATADRDWRNINILPLNIISFSVNYNTPIAQLSWDVENERTTNFYEVQISTDGSNFKTLASIEAVNNGSHHYTHPYSITNSSNVIYFRIKQTDKDGQIYFTKIIALRLLSDVELSVYPNPFKNNTNISYIASEDDKAYLSIISIDGKQILHKTLNTKKGSNTLLITELDKALPGIYYIKMNVNGSIKITKIIKMQ